MMRKPTKILLAFLICALPSLGGAAETAPAGGKATVPAPAATTAQPPVKAQTPPAPLPAVPVAPATSTAPAAPEASKPAEAPKPQRLRLGYVDVARVGSESSLGKASAAQAKQKQEKLQAQITARRKQLDKQKAAIEAQLAKLPPAEREAKAREKSKEFQKKIESFQKFGMNADKELQALQEGLGKSFNDAINQAAVDYGKANNLELVVVKREMLYLSSAVDAEDVTDGIIKLMNDRFVKK